MAEDYIGRHIEV